MPKTKPTREALAYIKDKDLRVGFDYRDVWREEHAASFTVAKATQVDVLDDIKAAVLKAQADGLPFSEFEKELTPILQKKGWWGRKDVRDPVTGKLVSAQLGSPRRLKTIYDANLRSAYAAGDWQRAQRAKRMVPYRLYLLGPSKEHRLEHLQWKGILLPIDDPFWNTHWPPNGWGCKCYTRGVSQAEYDRLVATGDYLTEAPPIKTKRWVNKRTGEVEQIPVGIDPGWHGNPGQDRLQVLRNKLANKINATDQAMAKAAVKQVMGGQLLQDWLAIIQDGNKAVVKIEGDKLYLADYQPGG